MNRQNYRGAAQPQINPATQISPSPLHLAMATLWLILAVYLINKFIRWFWKSEEMIGVIKLMKKESEETTKLVDNIGVELKKLN